MHRAFEILYNEPGQSRRLFIFARRSLTNNRIRMGQPLRPGPRHRNIDENIFLASCRKTTDESPLNVPIPIES